MLLVKVLFITCVLLLVLSKEACGYTYPEPLQCIYVSGFTPGNRSRELECCKSAFDGFMTTWSNRGNLSSYLEALRGWNCPQYVDECSNRTFAFTPLYKRLYERFCNTTELLVNCEARVRKLPLLRSNDTSTTNDTWKKLVSQINFQAITLEDYNDECVDVAAYDSPFGGLGNYHEIVAASIPFCELTTCAFDAATLANNTISMWTCLPVRCRANLIVSAIVVAILGAAVVIANGTVVYVLISSPKLRNSQKSYKLSLATADILVGLVVLATFISSVFKIVLYPHSLGNPQPVHGYRKQDILSGSSPNATTILIRITATYFGNYFSPSYLQGVGFFSWLSLAVSIYSLMLASVDRLWAVAWPLHFRKSNPRLVANIAVVFVWITAILIGSLPWIIPELEFGTIASILVLIRGRMALYLYIAALAIPLLVVWTNTLATYCVSKKHSRLRLHMTGRHKRKSDTNMESRLARTLALMVAAFTACLLPAAIILVIPFFVRNIYYSFPESLDTTAASVYSSFEFVAVIILMSNSLWNCFIYSLRNPDFKAMAKHGYSRLFQKLGLRYLSGKLGNLGHTVKYGNRRFSASATQTIDATTRNSLATSVVTLKESPRSNGRRPTSSSIDVNLKCKNSPKSKGRRSTCPDINLDVAVSTSTTQERRPTSASLEQNLTVKYNPKYHSAPRSASPARKVSPLTARGFIERRENRSAENSDSESSTGNDNCNVNWGFETSDKL